MKNAPTPQERWGVGLGRRGIFEFTLALGWRLGKTENSRWRWVGGPNPTPLRNFDNPDL